MYAEFEENYGLINHAMQIYDRAVKDIQDPDCKFECFNLHLAKTTQYFGLMSARQLFERAFGLLSGSNLIQAGLRFAKLERKLGEIERARNIYVHLSQFCNPNSQVNQTKIFWSIWEKFEVHFGDQDSYTDLMRTKRSVELRYSSVVENFAMRDEETTEKLEEDQESQEKRADEA